MSILRASHQRSGNGSLLLWTRLALHRAGHRSCDRPVAGRIARTSLQGLIANSIIGAHTVPSTSYRHGTAWRLWHGRYVPRSTAQLEEETMKARTWRIPYRLGAAVIVAMLTLALSA